MRNLLCLSALAAVAERRRSQVGPTAPRSSALTRAPTPASWQGHLPARTRSRRTARCPKPTLAAEMNESVVRGDPSEQEVPLRRRRNRQGAGVVAFAIDAKTGDLTLLNPQSSGGGGPCHLIVDPSGKTVLAANYGGGSCMLHPDRKPTASSAKRRPSISTRARASAGNQEGPHAHSINLDKANKFAFCCDLGLDKVLVYTLRPGQGNADAERPARVRHARRRRPAPFRLPSQRQDGLHQRRNRHDDHRLRLRRRQGGPDAEAGPLDLPKDARTQRGQHRGDRRASVRQVRLRLQPRRHNSIAIFAIDPKTRRTDGGRARGRAASRRRATSPSSRRASTCWSPIRAGNSVISFRIDPDDGRIDADGQQRRSRVAGVRAVSCRLAK